MDIYDACMYDERAWLQSQRDAGTLPNLMDDDATHCQWYPHELAIRCGHLDLLKWLVNESGQVIDLTVSNNQAIITAAAYERVEILRWLVLESNQPVLVKLDSNDTDWYKSDYYSNPEITSFLEAVNELHVVGVSIERIRQNPGMVTLVESGRLTAAVVNLLTADDLNIALQAQAVSKSTATAMRRF